MNRKQASLQHYQRGREHFDRSEFDDAIAEFNVSLQQDVHFKTLELLGETFMRMERWQNAIIPLAAATTLNRQSRAPALLAKAYLELNEIHEATEIARVALARDPDNHLAQEVLKRTESQS